MLCFAVAKRITIEEEERNADQHDGDVDQREEIGCKESKKRYFIFLSQSTIKTGNPLIFSVTNL